MHQSILIIDDFLEDPEHFRRIAKNMTFPDLRNISHFPGRNSLQRLKAPDIDSAIEGLLGEKLVPLEKLSHAKFRLTLASDEGNAKVHLDASQWSGILYLSPGFNENAGTHFFRHKETGLDSTLLSKDKMKRLGWKNEQEADNGINKIIERDTNNDDAWDLIMKVPMKYNRLLLLRPWLWHTAGEGFGTDFDNGRLVYLLFYNLKK